MNTKSKNSYKAFVKAKNDSAKAKKQYESKLAQEAKTNKKVIWKYINSRSKSSKSIGHLRNKDGTLTETDKETAEALANQ